MKYNFKNQMIKSKGGQIESIILVVILIFIIGVLVVFGNYTSNKIYSSFDQYFQDNPKYNNTEAHTAIVSINDQTNEIWDYAFLAIFVGYLLQMVLLSFGTRIHIAFYWIYALFGAVGLTVGVIISNMWQGMMAAPVMADTIARFPITNMLLGTYYPMAITALLLIVIIVTFGKSPERMG